MDSRSSARDASVAGREVVYTSYKRDLQSWARDASVSRQVTRADPAPSAKSKPATRKAVQSAEPEDDAFDRAIAEALKAGLLDDMIADALQAQRDGKTTPL